MVPYYGEIAVTDDPIYDVVKLQNEVIGIVNDFPIRHNITPYSSHLNILKFVIVKLHTCFFMIIYGMLNPPILYYHYYQSNAPILLVMLYIPISRTNVRKFCSTVIGR